jgi:hypothetical protein
MQLRRGGTIPYVMVSQITTPTSLTNGAYTAVVWDNIIDDPYKMAAAASSVITIPFEGIWLCEGAVAHVASAVAHRFFVALQYSAVQWRGTSVQAIVSGAPTTGVSRLMHLHKGDTIALAGFQDSGGALNTAPATENAPYFNLHWLSPGK